MSYATYVKDRLTGFAGSSNTFVYQDLAEFENFARRVFGDPGRWPRRTRACAGPIGVSEPAAPLADIDNLKAALTGVDAAGAFLSAAPPGVISLFFRNGHYANQKAYLFAIAGAMRGEYEAIAAAGVTLQSTAPTWRWAGTSNADFSIQEFRRRAGSMSRRDQLKLPDGKIINPGVIKSKSNFIERPELIAPRIARYANRVRRDTPSPAAVAASAPGSARLPSILTSCGPNCRRWPRAPGGPRNNSGAVEIATVDPGRLSSAGTDDRGAMTRPDRNTVIFDLGGVLIEWDPRHLYRKLFAGDEVAMEEFLAGVCTHEWNRGQDAGRSFAEGARLLKALHPGKAELIDAYRARFDEMMPGPIEGSLAILAELRERGTPLYALSNFSAETYPSTFARFEFLRWFRGIVVSGEVRAIKPEAEIYRALIETYAIDPQRAVFIDDAAVNAAAAAKFGIHAIHFTTPDALRAELVMLGLLD